MSLHAFQFLVLLFSCWLGRRQQAAIDYLKEENHILLGKIKGKRIRFTDKERRRLAAKAKILGRKKLKEITCIVTPDTLLRWYRTLIAQKYDGSKKRGPGRPRTQQVIRDLVITMALDNPGYVKLKEMWTKARCVIVMPEKQGFRRRRWIFTSHNFFTFIGLRATG